MSTIQTTAETIATGDRITLAGAPFVVTARVHGAWYLDCPRARYVEFELAQDTTPPLVGTNGRSVVRLPKDTPVSVDRPVTPPGHQTSPRDSPCHLPNT